MSLTKNNIEWMANSVLLLFCLLYLSLQRKLHSVCERKQTLDEEDEVVKTPTKLSKEKISHNLKMQEIQTKIFQKYKLLKITLLFICPLMLFFGFLSLAFKQYIVKWSTIGLSIIFLILFIYCHASRFILLIKQKQLSDEKAVKNKKNY